MNAISICLFLYYFADKEEFNELRELVVSKACERISQVPTELRRKTSEMVILLLDLMACPTCRWRASPKWENPSA